MKQALILFFILITLFAKSDKDLSMENTTMNDEYHSSNSYEDESLFEVIIIEKVDNMLNYLLNNTKEEEKKMINPSRQKIKVSNQSLKQEQTERKEYENLKSNETWSVEDEILINMLIEKLLNNNGEFRREDIFQAIVILDYLSKFKGNHEEKNEKKEASKEEVVNQKDDKIKINKFEQCPFSSKEKIEKPMEETKEGIFDEKSKDNLNEEFKKTEKTACLTILTEFANKILLDDAMEFAFSMKLKKKSEKSQSKFEKEQPKIPIEEFSKKTHYW